MNVYKCLILLILVMICVGCTTKTCENEYLLVDDMCEKTSIIDAYYNTSYYCNESIYNEQLVGTRCVWYSYTSTLISYECPDDYSGYSICSHRYGKKTDRCAINYVEYRGMCYPQYVNATKKEYCMSGYSYYNGRCRKENSYHAYVKYNYYCPIGYDVSDVSEKLCVKTDYAEPTVEFSLFS